MGFHHAAGKKESRFRVFLEKIHIRRARRLDCDDSNDRLSEIVELRRTKELRLEYYRRAQEDAMDPFELVQRYSSNSEGLDPVRRETGEHTGRSSS